MKYYHKNPRQITDRQFNDLRRWLRELGDLSGIVHDLNSDEIIGGNQRARVFDINQCEVVLTDGPHEPDEQGTVALGYVLWQGKRYGYRQVRWTEEQAAKANVVANRSGGDWDWDVLANEFDVGDLLEWGFEEGEFGIVAPDEYEDYSDLDAELSALAGMEDVNVVIAVPEKHQETVKEWLANGESQTAPGMGKGVLRRCGLL